MISRVEKKIPKVMVKCEDMTKELNDAKYLDIGTDTKEVLAKVEEN